jgi:hypothetical protein
VLLQRAGQDIHPDTSEGETMMASTVFGLLISLAFAWAGRDKVWAPKFEGPPAARFEQAMRHYEDKMGLGPLVVEVSPDPRVKLCSSVRSDAYGTVRVTWYANAPKRCASVRPEVWALHEACHVRFQHHRRAVTGKAEEREAERCMKLYSEKARR